jgi:Haem-binding domain
MAKVLSGFGTFIRRQPTALLGAATVVLVTAVGSWLIGLQPVAALLIVVVCVGPALWLVARQSRRQRTNEKVGPGSVLGDFAVVGIVAMLAMQVVPYGRSHAKRPITGEPAWSSPRTRELMVRACFSCHSNEVTWPWYSNVAPISWAVSDHVSSGRSSVNYSEFTTGGEKSDETVSVIKNRTMPPPYFTRFGLHSGAKLTDAEVTELVNGLLATPGFEGGGSGEGG